MMKAVTPHTAVTLSQLHAQLETDRTAGLAWSDGNYEADIGSVAAAIFDATDAPIAALTSAANQRISRARRGAVRSPPMCERPPMRFRSGSAGADRKPLRWLQVTANNRPRA
jgi:hypothetical protein